MFGFIFSAIGHATAVTAHGGNATTHVEARPAPSCALQMQDLQVRAESALRDVFSEDNGWVRIHAAEALVEFGQAEFVRGKLLNAESELADAEYRIGVWRVLAATAPDKQSRQGEISKIVRVFTNPASADRKQAIESLGKLREPLHSEALQAAQSLAEIPLNADSIIPAWALHYSQKDTDFVTLMLDGLHSPSPLLRQRCAYVLRWIDKQDDRIGPALKNTIRDEPPGTRAYTFILSSALMLNASDDPAQLRQWQNQLLEILLTGPVAERFEASHALAMHATLQTAKTALPLLDAPEAGTRVSAARIILAALRNSAAIQE